MQHDIEMNGLIVMDVLYRQRSFIYTADVVVNKNCVIRHLRAALMCSSPGLWEHLCWCFLSCRVVKQNLNQCLNGWSEWNIAGHKHQDWVTLTYILNVYKSVYFMWSSVKQSKMQVEVTRKLHWSQSWHVRPHTEATCRCCFLPK